MRRGIVVAIIVFSLLSPLIAISCEATGEPEAEAVIGPDGGDLEVTDPASPAYGVRMEIPEGALEEPAVVSIYLESNAPALPDGFNTGATAVDLDVSAEVLHAVEIEFPVDYMPTPTEGLPCAFFYDEVAEKWRLVLPSDIDYDNMVMKIETSHLSIWKWGWIVIDILTDGAVSEAIQDALIEAVGEDRWNTLVGSAESLAEDIIDLAEEITTDAACATIEGTKNALSLTREFLDSELQYLYEDPVGLCDDKLVWCGPMSNYFFEHIPERLIELFVEKTVVGVCEAIVGHTPVLMVTNILSLGLALAYSPCVICYINLSELNPTFWGLLGSYYVATFGVEMAEAALDDLGCDDITPMVAAGAWHTVGLKSDGTVVAVGHSDYGECDVGGWTDIVQAAAGGHHTVGLKSDGTVVAVGFNSEGECNVSGWANIVQVTGGKHHTVGLKSDGTVVAVGWNNDGQCNVGGWTDIVQVAGGRYHTVGRKLDGTVVAVGYNYHGQCNVSGWTDIVQVAAGHHTVARKSDGTVIAVGRNDFGQCHVSGWTDIIQVAAGWLHTVGLKSDGTVVAVGWNSDGECDVGGWTDIVQAAAGGYHTVGLKSDGTVVVVGSNYYGQCDVDSWDLN